MTDLLQKELGFQGLCFTDALAMKGASTKKTDNPSVKALLAGMISCSLRPLQSMILRP